MSRTTMATCVTIALPSGVDVMVSPLAIREPAAAWLIVPIEYRVVG